MTNENKKCYPDRINKMLLDDTYRSLHNWNVHRNMQYLENLKQTTGIKPNKGPWSASEIKQLEDNMKLYQSLNPNVKIFKLLYEKKSKTKQRIYIETQFWDLLSYNLCRKMESIHLGSISYFSKKAGFKAGTYSKQEYKFIRELVNKHGQNWQLISNLTNRCATSLSMTYNSNIKNNVNSGPWNKDEKDKFICIVKQLMHYNQRNQLPLLKINFRIVSYFVQTRSSLACSNFLKVNKFMLENMFISNKKNSSYIVEEAMILYTYF